MSKRNSAIETEKKHKTNIETSYDYVERFDILETINNVGNDEIFTPVATCKKMLDMLPNDVWSNPNYKWLNPCDKNGVFLREVALRLDKGLEDVIPDQEERRKHILTEMLYSIGLTKFTAMVSRRTVYYCAQANRPSGGNKDADGHSLYGNAIHNGEWFDNENGNILTPTANHDWDKNGKCKHCPANKYGKNDTYTKYGDPEQKEHFAYEFIHHKSKLDLEIYLANNFFGGKDMKFDIIIGNPPYQLDDGGAKASATPIYNYFVQMAKSLNPKYICFIIPSRWMAGGKVPEEFRKEMITDQHIKVMHDYLNFSDCFPGVDVDIMGGVCYYLWDRDNVGPCDIYTHDLFGNIEHTKRYLAEPNLYGKKKGMDVYIRFKTLLDIYKKCSNEKPFSDIVSPRMPYGLPGEVFNKPEKYHLPPFSNDPFNGSLKIWGLEGGKGNRVAKYIDKDNPKIKDKFNNIDKYKVFLPESNGSGAIGEVMSTQVIGMPIVGEPGTICTETFISIGRFDTEEEAKNCEGYIKTKFFRAILDLKKITQHNAQETFDLVPVQDFSRPWTDADLYEKYNLTQEEIDFIEKNIAEMD